MSRVYTIDYLRGLLAFFIMIYHYLSWQSIVLIDATSFLARNALYGVSLFFIISGFSLTVTYYNKFKYINHKLLYSYFIKRFARIYPLFFLVVIAYVFMLHIAGKEIPELPLILSNLTISFAFFEEFRGLTAGSWSIGIEIVFYVLFPIIIYFLYKFNITGIIILILFILLSIYISSYEMYEEVDGVDYFDKYLNLINHLYFFAFGILIGILYLKRENIFYLNMYVLISFIIITLAIIILYPISGSHFFLLYQSHRVILSLLIFILFILFVMLNFHCKNQNIVTKYLSYFGDISYTLYLLHPIVYLIVFRRNNV